ncbi:hypothetical protein [Vibrio owensii]|uniref:Uncharacterized protein n=1 Tax=Vibrio owensii CAIM 1854 = LMG 25443 TaxID=1229493 RepID=A0A0C1VMN7_9VIBR|nr:hypothetical protein [Vibrio owensii]KIF45317.1 hypothetical protein H735_29700 [Vibrio owensii CAIM 1854 = LMG 25443]
MTTNISQSLHIKLLGIQQNVVPTGYKSWLHFWETQLNISASECIVVGCNKRAVHGREVVIGSSAYIIPLCKIFILVDEKQDIAISRFVAVPIPKS